MRYRDGSATSNKLGELTLIERIRRCASGLRGTGVSLGIGDDCALLRLKPGEEVAVTTDLSVQDRHFRLDRHPAEAVGHRTLARGLSDIAAMGARPVAAFLSLGLPPELTRRQGRRPAWIDGFLEGFVRLAEQYGVPLAGGDLAQAPVALADIVLIGAVPRGSALLRSGARPGDILYVTGTLGGSAFGLRQLSEGGGRLKASTARELGPHLWPQPRVAQGLWLRRHGAATSAIDISDGLSTDLTHLCEESHVCAELSACSIPRFGGATLEDALHGGEDYELLFTARPKTRIPRKLAGVPVSRIGTMMKTSASRPRIVLADGDARRALKARGWEHFRGR